MNIIWEGGLLKHLTFKGVECIDWGVETADRHSFFTLTETPVDCSIHDTASLCEEPLRASRSVDVDMREGRWTLEVVTDARPNAIRVTQSLLCTESSVFQDFVMRFKFTKDSFQFGNINNKTIFHTNSNRWHQHSVDRVAMYNKNYFVLIKTLFTETASKFDQEMYIRDEPNFWIVHIRLMPKEPCDLYWIKWSNRFFKLSVGHKLSKLILLIPNVKRMLWYLSERLGGRPQLQAQGLSRLHQCERLQIVAEVCFEGK